MKNSSRRFTLMLCDLKYYSIVVFISLSNLAHSQIYKCMGDAGEVKYQSKECGINERSKIMTIKQEPKSVVKTEPTLKHVSKNAPLDEYKNSPERAMKKRLKEQKKQKCRVLKRQFKREEKKVYGRCKKNREIYCHLSAVGIVQNERRRAAFHMSRTGLGGSGRNSTNSPVERLHKQLNRNGCR